MNSETRNRCIGLLETQLDLQKLRSDGYYQGKQITFNQSQCGNWPYQKNGILDRVQISKELSITLTISLFTLNSQNRDNRFQTILKKDALKTFKQVISCVNFSNKSFKTFTDATHAVDTQLEVYIKNRLKSQTNRQKAGTQCRTERRTQKVKLVFNVFFIKYLQDIQCSISQEAIQVCVVEVNVVFQSFFAVITTQNKRI